MKRDDLIFVGLFFLFITSSSVHAERAGVVKRNLAQTPQEKEAIEDPYYVYSPDGSVQAKDLGEGMKDAHPVKEKSQLPELSARDRAFAKAGLQKEIEGFDEFDLDILYISAQKYILEELVQKYPKIARTKLQKLIKAVNAK